VQNSLLSNSHLDEYGGFSDFDGVVNPGQGLREKKVDQADFNLKSE
jgi:hypothetical protein